MEKLLQKINSILQKEKVLKEERKRRGDFFNIFEVMRAENDEVHTHSALLAELLNSKGKHGCGNSFCDLFGNIIESSINNISNAQQDVLHSVGKEAHAYVEYCIDNNTVDKEEGGRLDILLKGNGKAIIIENKIYASDQEKQLYRYKKFADKKYGKGNYLILYLTLDGHSPDEKSIKGNEMTMEEEKDFFCISYKDHILRWLSLCKEKATNIPTVRETLTQYYNLIAKLTHQDMEQTTKEELVALLATKENVAALFKIKNTHNDVLNKICNTKLKKQVKKIAKELSLECDFRCRSWNAQYSHFAFKVASWKHFCIMFEFRSKDFHNMVYGIRYADKEQKEQRDQYTDLVEKLKERTGIKDSDNWWACYKEFKYRDWNDNDGGTFERLYDGSIKKAIKEKVEELLSQTRTLNSEL